MRVAEALFGPLDRCGETVVPLARRPLWRDAPWRRRSLNGYATFNDLHPRRVPERHDPPENDKRLDTLKHQLQEELVDDGRNAPDVRDLDDVIAWSAWMST
jgi:hypothetical protein